MLVHGERMCLLNVFHKFKGGSCGIPVSGPKFKGDPTQRMLFIQQFQQKKKNGRKIEKMAVRITYFNMYRISPQADKK